MNGSLCCRLLFWNILFFASPLLAQSLGDVFGQAASVRVVEGKFTRFGMKDGLSQMTVESLTRGPLGYLWIATQSGLNRFDGYHFKTYYSDPSDPRTLPSSFISGLYLDERNVLWIGGGQTLSYYVPESDDFQRLDVPDERNGNIHTMIEIGEDLLVGSEQGLMLVNRETLAVKPLDFDKRAMSILKDTEGRYWLAGEEGIYQYDPEQESVTLVHRTDVVVISLCLDREGWFWGSLRGEGTFRYNPATGAFRFFKMNDYLPHISRIYTGRGDNIWFVGRGGLFSYSLNTKQFSTVRDHNFDSLDLFLSGRALFEDVKGIIWIGLLNEGLLRYDPLSNRLGHHPARQGRLPDKQVHSFSEDHDNGLWIATGKGLCRLDLESGEYTPIPEIIKKELADEDISTVLMDSKNRLWISTLSDGVKRLDPGATRLKTLDYRPPDGGETRHLLVDHIFERNENEFWLTVRSDGVYVFRDDQSMQHIGYDPNDPKALGSRYVFDVHTDDTDSIWLATFGNGLYHQLEDGTFKRFTIASHGFSSDYLSALEIDEQGQIWIGSMDGLMRFDPKTEKVQNFSENDGLVNNTVYAVLIDNQKQVWASTNQGMARYRPSTQEFSAFGLEDGAQHLEYHGRSALKLRDGRLAFGGVNGFNLFDPSRVDRQQKIPNAILTELLVSNTIQKIDGTYLEKPLAMSEHLRFPNDMPVFAFEFSVLEALEPTKLQYAYKMEPLEEEWLFTNAERRYASYTNLSAGTYTFRVKAGYPGGPWESVGQSIKVTVAPSMWATPLAYFLYIVMVLAGIRTYTYYQQRLRLYLEKKVEQRTEALKDVRRDMLDMAHMSGMAELAMDVLHRLGNQLNNVKTSVQLVVEKSHRDRGIDALTRLADQLEAIDDDSPEMQRKQLAALPSYLRRITDGLKHERSKMLEQTQNLDTQMQEITNTLLEQQAYTTSSQKLVVDIDLTSILRKLLEQEAFLFEEKRVYVKSELMEGIAIKGEPFRLKRAICALFELVRETAGEEGCILSISLKRDDTNVMIHLKDTGEGISEEELDAAFHREGQAEEQQFGLHYCANVIHEMDGTLEVESHRDGRGTRICIVFRAE